MSNTDKEVTVKLSFLADVVNIIDVVSKRGAFDGQELSKVGTVRDYCNSFLVAEEPVIDEVGFDSTKT